MLSASLKASLKRQFATQACQTHLNFLRLEMLSFGISALLAQGLLFDVSFLDRSYFSGPQGYENKNSGSPGLANGLKAKTSLSVP